MRFGLLTVAPMQLFISHGHDANRAFVLRVKSDLARHSHECWIDSDRVHEHLDWRRSGPPRPGLRAGRVIHPQTWVGANG
jgi:hypothetical protein